MSIQIESDLKEILERIEKRFDKVDEKFEKLDNKIDQLGNKVDGIDKRLIKVETKLDSELPDATKSNLGVNRHSLYCCSRIFSSCWQICSLRKYYLIKISCFFSVNGLE